jgi:hypothetical protein
MADFAKALTNPYVLGGGALLGVILLMSNKGAPSNGGAPVTPGYNSIMSAYNMAALEATTEQARISADYGKHIATADVTKQIGILSAINARDANLRMITVQRIQSNEGIVKTQLQTSAAMQIDMQQQIAKMNIAGMDVTKQAITTNGQVKIAQIQAKAQKKAALYKAIGSVTGGLIDAGLAVATGGASLVATQAAPKAAGASGNYWDAVTV